MPQRIRSGLTYANEAPALAALAVLLISAIVALMAVDDGPALAAHQVKCGDTITGDTTLHTDLVNCPNNGLLIGADDITLDLNGQVIDSDGLRSAAVTPRRRSATSAW